MKIGSDLFLMICDVIVDPDARVVWTFKDVIFVLLNGWEPLFIFYHFFTCG